MQEEKEKSNESNIALCVDLDGTLSRSDTLLEQIFALIRHKPFKTLLIFIWLFKGKVFFKRKVAEQSAYQPMNLPFNGTLVNALKQEYGKGRPIYLVTGAHLSFALKVSDYLPIFADVLATDKINLIGKVKAHTLVDRFGEKNFDYIGNSLVDIPIWKKARKGICVNKRISKSSLIAAQDNIVCDYLESDHSLAFNIIKQIRLHQWAKNILVFLPMVLSHTYNNSTVWMTSFAAMFAFACLSSCVYLINDVLDLDADRQHPDNKNRPFASGRLSLLWLPILMPVLSSIAIGLALNIGINFLWVLAGYFVFTSFYSIKLKKIPIADILMLALLYSWRVFAGSIATGIELSNWFLTFAIFFFFSLALLKRCSELQLLRSTTGSHNSRRGYRIDDLNLLQTFGIASGYLSVLVLALYLNDPKLTVQKLYPGLLWLICPLLLYWLSRLWLAAFRGQIPSDPLIFALKDNESYFIILIISILWLASKGW